MRKQPIQVVVAYNFTATGHEALTRAVAIAGRAPSHILHFVCVIESRRGIPGIPLDGKPDYRYAQKVQEALTEIVGNELSASDTVDRVHFYIHARFGRAADEILGLAREVGADLILLGTKGLTGVERFMLGSVAEHVVREAGCCVEVVRPKTYSHVELLAIEDVAADAHPYVAPHRYFYESSRVQLRPIDWPLY